MTLACRTKQLYIPGNTVPKKNLIGCLQKVGREVGRGLEWWEMNDLDACGSVQVRRTRTRNLIPDIRTVRPLPRTRIYLPVTGTICVSGRVCVSA